MKSKDAEIIVRWYLRFNGYFSIENFIVHAGDDSSRICDGNIGCKTETDILSIRMPYSREVTGKLRIANHEKLIEKDFNKFDIIIAEVKTGNSNKPNPVWKNKDIDAISYLIRFYGIYKDEDKINEISKKIANFFFFEDKDYRIRYIIFSNKPSNFYQNQGLHYITYKDIIEFIVDVRGNCWARENIGIKSTHYQWDELINKIYEISNNMSISELDRKNKIARCIGLSDAKKV